MISRHCYYMIYLVRRRYLYIGTKTTSPEATIENITWKLNSPWPVISRYTNTSHKMVMQVMRNGFNFLIVDGNSYVV